MKPSFRDLFPLAAPIVGSQTLNTLSNFLSHYLLVRNDAKFLDSLPIIANSQTFLLQIPDSCLYIMSNMAGYSLGAKKHDELGPTLRAGYALAFIINVPQSIFLNTLPWLLSVANQPPEVTDAVSQYSPWYTLGASLTTFNTVNKRFLIGIHEQKIVFISTGLASIARGIAVHFLTKQWGMPGYALAETLYAAVDFAILTGYLLRPKFKNLQLFKRSFDKQKFLELLKSGSPIIVKWVVISGMVYYMDFLTGKIGNIALAATGVVRQYYAWPLGAFVGLADATGVLISNALGENKLDKIVPYLRSSLMVNLPVAGLASVLFSVLGKELATLFVSDEQDKEAIIDLAQALFYVHVGWLLLDAIRSILDSSLNGIKKSMVPMKANLISTPFILFLTYTLGFLLADNSVVGVYLGACLASMLETAVSGYYWYQEEKQISALVAQQRIGSGENDATSEQGRQVEIEEQKAELISPQAIYQSPRTRDDSSVGKPDAFFAAGEQTRLILQQQSQPPVAPNVALEASETDQQFGKQ